MTILSPGDALRETYVVERKLGEGAFAEVYRVRHRFMGRQAMKVFKYFAQSFDEIEVDLQEAIILSKMKHPNIVEIYDANVLKWRGRDIGYFTMTYMPGGTLERYWRSFGAKLMPVEAVVSIIRQVSMGLTLAHAQTPPLIHRDIKPANILIGFEPAGVRARLSDFGLAKNVNPITLLATAKGTLGFKPPEALRNIDSAAADIWAIGSTLYLLLTDEMPFPMLDSRDAGEAGRFLRPLRPPSLYNASVDAGLESIIYRCLAARPGDRYPDAASLLQDLDRWRPGLYEPAASGSESRVGTKVVGVDRSLHDLKAEAKHALEEAGRLARDPAQLTAAADLLEEAISKDPDLAKFHADRLQLWRKGIMMPSTSITKPRQRGRASRL